MVYKSYQASPNTVLRHLGRSANSTLYTLSKLSRLSSSEANLRCELAYAKSNYETKLIQQFAYTNNSKIMPLHQQSLEV